MFNKFELIGGGIAVASMALAIYLVQVESTFYSSAADFNQRAQAIEADNPGVVIVGQDGESNQARANAYVEASDTEGNFERMVIDDITVGTGEVVSEGDTVVVHYVGQLQSGQEFDNSRERGVPFEFTVGEGTVIDGWDQGVLGMQEGGERILVIPPELAYGESGVGPIPGDATLVFSIELLEIK
jgi:FKBP-type peptidyl-prolyl cis-trans isomerase